MALLVLERHIRMRLMLPLLNGGVCTIEKQLTSKPAKLYIAARDLALQLLLRSPVTIKHLVDDACDPSHFQALTL